MAFAKDAPNWVEIPYGSDVRIDDAVSSYATIELWAEADRNALGICTVVEQEIPPGKRSVGSEIVNQAGVPVRQHTFVDILEPVPEVISDRQFAEELANRGAISRDEAIAWASKGDLPATLTAALADLPEDIKFKATMLLSSATTYERSHPMTATVGGLLWYEADDLDSIWRAAAKL